MTLTARETMQALLDGKTLRYTRHDMDVRYKLDDAGNLLQTHGCSYVVLRSWTLSDLEVYEEYPLTFEQALREMLDGKVVEVENSDPCLRFSHRFNREFSHFEYRTPRGSNWMATHITGHEQEAKWKVVE